MVPTHFPARFVAGDFALRPFLGDFALWRPRSFAGDFALWREDVGFPLLLLLLLLPPLRFFFGPFSEPTPPWALVARSPFPERAACDRVTAGEARRTIASVDLRRERRASSDSSCACAVSPPEATALDVVAAVRLFDQHVAARAELRVPAACPRDEPNLWRIRSRKRRTL